MKTIKSILAVVLCAVGLAAFAKEHDLVVLNVDGSPATDGYYWNENAAISALVITNNELTVTGTSTTERVELRSAQKLTLRDLYIDLAANTNSGKTCLAPYNAAPVTVNIEGRVVMHTTSNAIYMHDGGTLTIGGSGEISMTVEKQYAAVYVGKGGGLVIADSVNLMARCTIARAFATDEDKGGTITISGSGRIDLRSESKAGIFAETETGKLTIAQTATNVIVRGFTPGEEGGYLPGETGALEFHVDDAVSLPSGWGILSSPDIDAADMPVAAEMKQVPEHDDGLNAYTCYIGEDFARAVTFGPVESLTLPAVLGATASVGGLAMPAGIVGVPAGKTSVVTWTAKAGYKITSGESESLVMDGPKTAQAPTVVHVGQGTEEDPWEAGKTADDSVVAWTNGVGGLVVEGAGAMKAFNGKTDPAPWGNTITEVEIGEDVTALGANAFNGCDALTDVTLKATQPPVVGMNAFKGCDALETINVPLWSSGAYLHTDGWMDYTIVEPQTPQIWADGHRVAADKQVGVCSWTWHGDMETVLKEMQADGRYNGMQLALAPWLGIDSMSLYFGGKESTEMWEFIKEKIASGELNVMSTMINFPKEDYTTIQSITNTMGYMYGVADGASDAEEQWATNLFLTAEAARLSKELGVDTLTTEAGFICIDENLMFERMKEVCMTCAVHGVQILIESGPQTSLFLTNLLVNLEKEGYTNVGINFDPGDTQLFFSYDALNHETPTDSYAIMKPWIRMVHVKDCKLDRPAWNEDCVWGDGIVSQMDFNDWAKVGGDVERHFLEQLAAEGYTGNILYERLSGDETLTPARKEEITQAMDRIFAALPAPIVAESDEFTVDLRTRVELAEGETTVSNVTWSATLWGAVGETFTTVSYENLTTGETGVFGNLSNIMGEGATDAVLPLKDGEYVLTHSTGDLKSLATFVVSGYPLGSESNPWKVGPADDPESTVAWTDGDGTVYFKPPRSDVSREGLETITNALGGTGFDMALVAADGTATNDVVALVGDDGMSYDTLADVFAADPMPTTVRLYEVPGQTISLPAGIAGEAFVVSNLTTGAEITPSSTLPGGAEYVLPLGAKVAIYVVPSDGYRLIDDGTNPIVIDEVTTETTVEVSEIPTVKSLAEESAIGDSDVTWKIEDGVLVIEGSGDMPDFDEANPAPWNEFSDKITAVSVGEGVEHLGDAAFFACPGATSITLANEEGIVNLAAFVSPDGSATSFPAEVDVVEDGATVPAVRFESAGGESYDTLADAYAAGETELAPLSLNDVKEEYIEELEELAGSEPRSEAMQEQLATATAAILAATTVAEADSAMNEKGLPVSVLSAKEAVEAAAGDPAKRSKELQSVVDQCNADLDDAKTFEEVAAVRALYMAAVKKIVGESGCLYPSGDGGVFVTPAKASAYEGVVLDASGKVSGTINVKLSKPSKKGVMKVTAKVKTFVDKRTYSFKLKDVPANVNGPLVVSLDPSNKKSAGHALAIAVEGDSLTGAFDDGSIDAACNVFKRKGDPKRDAVKPIAGVWTGAFTCDAGEIYFSAKLRKSGSASVKVMLPNGKKASVSSKIEVGDNVVAVPVTVSKVVKGVTMTFGFRLAFVAGGDAVTINVTPLETRDKSKTVLSSDAAELLAVGMQKVTSKEFKTYQVAVDPALEAALGPITKNNLRLASASGWISGSLKFGKVSGNASGVVVNGAGIGKVSVKINRVKYDYQFVVAP